MNIERQTKEPNQVTEKQLLAGVPGVPSVFTDKKSKQLQLLQKRARSKYFSLALAQELALCNSSLKKSYERTLNCCSIITQQGQQLTSTYCGGRWCIVCNRIRTAKLLNKYEPHLADMFRPHFVTLTIPNVTGNPGEIYKAVQQIQSWSRKTLDLLRKYKIHFKGFRKIEITYNAAAGTFHPHIHILTDGTICTDEWTKDDSPGIALVHRVWKNQKLSEKKFAALLERYNKGKISTGFFKAELLRQMWLKHFPAARAVAQDVRPANVGSLKELFKYSAKVLSKSKRAGSESWELKTYTTKNGEQRTVKKKISRSQVQCYVTALDKIYCAIYGKRVLQPIGFKKWEQKAFNELANGNVQDDLQAQEFTELQEQATAWHWNGNDWHEINSGTRLCSWQPGRKDKEAATCFIFDSG